MTVKDLVHFYEQSPSSGPPQSVQPPSPGQSRRPERTTESITSLRTDVRIAEASERPPRLARFIKHANEPDPRYPTHGRQFQPPNFQNEARGFPITSSTTVANLYNNNHSLEILDEDSTEESTSELYSTTSTKFKLSTQNLVLSSSSQYLLRQSSNDIEEQRLLGKHNYPPKTNWSNGNHTAPKSPHHRRRPSHALHTPISAPVIFSRNAYPLSLPKLDQYLSSLSPPVLGDECDPSGAMFPPLDQLEKTGLSLDDLESNATVAPAWRNRKSILGSLVNILIGFLGSSALASFYSLQGLISTVQIFALILSTIVPMGGRHLEDKWRELFLGTIPNVLALNFAPVLFQSLIFLVIFMIFASGLLYYFYCATIQCNRYTSIEGLQEAESRGKQWGLVIVTFLLTVLYLPLSTMSVHVLVWSEELWPIANPYVNSTVFPPVVAPLGPSDEFRDPLDFCWTTTMKRNEFNFAPFAVILSAIVFVFFAVWYPIALRSVINISVPKVDKFTELGRPRSQVDMDGEYHLLLERDRNPFSFLYNSFRRGWGTYMSTYLFAKLSTLVIIAVVDPDNCLFRSFSRSTIPIARQSLLLTSTLGFFIAQCIFTPFLDPVNNASEWTSRLNYLTTSATALAITLNIPGKSFIDSYVLYCIYIITYGLGFYFTLINFGWMQRNVKRWTRRIDFSVDIFSPRLDTSSSSVHTKRRIWQESITALLLTDPDCAIPKKQTMSFAQSRDSQFPPYLLGFMGSPGERHVENLKIFREVGSLAYSKAVALVSGPDFALYRHLEDVIQKNYIGPDSYWKRVGEGSKPNCRSNFGNAWWIPFPPTLVIRYDEGPYTVLNEAADLAAYIAQNSSRDIERRRSVRMSLRALEGRIVEWPYDYVQPVGSHANWCCGRRYHAVTSKRYEPAAFSIKRRGYLMWQGLHLGSGFDIQLKFGRDVQVSGEIIGLNDDFDLTPTLARFLEINRQLIDEGLFELEERLSQYRRHYRKESHWKERVLTYKSLTLVYDKPTDSEGMAQRSIEFEKDHRVCRLMSNSEVVFRSAYTRLSAVSTSEAATWWYIFWDDLWRRNHDTVAGLNNYPADFNPHYRTSIAYMPIPRPALEAFLTQRGLLHKKPRWHDFFHTGFLNKIYLRLNDAVFRDSQQAIMFHIDNDTREMDMEDIDDLTQGQLSTLGTGPGTDHDYSGIRVRPAYRWEGLLGEKASQVHSGNHGRRRRWTSKLGAWLGITPVWLGTSSTAHEISLDVKLERGKYVLLTDDKESKGEDVSQLPLH